MEPRQTHPIRRTAGKERLASVVPCSGASYRSRSSLSQHLPTGVAALGGAPKFKDLTGGAAGILQATAGAINGMRQGCGVRSMTPILETDSGDSSPLGSTSISLWTLNRAERRHRRHPPRLFQVRGRGEKGGRGVTLSLSAFRRPHVLDTHPLFHYSGSRPAWHDPPRSSSFGSEILRVRFKFLLLPLGRSAAQRRLHLVALKEPRQTPVSYDLFPFRHIFSNYLLGKPISRSSISVVSPVLSLPLPSLQRTRLSRSALPVSRLPRYIPPAYVATQGLGA